MNAIEKKVYENELEKSFEIPKRVLFKLFQEGILKKISSEKIQQKWCFSGKAEGGVAYSSRVRAVKSTNSGISYEYEYTTKYYLANDKRIEINSKITKQEYDTIFSLHPQGKVVNKTRLLFKAANGNPDIYSVDLFGDKEGAIVEIEFTTQEGMNNWVTPEWALSYVEGGK